MNLAESKTIEIILAEILMEETTHSGGFLMVEGSDDRLFWRGRVNSQSCKLIICGGKANVVGAAAELDGQNNQRVLGVVDADFDRVADFEISYSERLVSTDEHDLDVMLLLSPALERVLLEQADQENFAGEHSQSLSECMTDYAMSFGRLRYLHSQAQCSFKFDEFSPYRYISIDNFSFDQQKLMQDFSQLIEWGDQTLVDALQQIPVTSSGQIVQGHDALRILCIALKGVCKLSGSKSIDEAELRKFLRLAFHRDDLCATNMYQSLLDKDSEWGLSMFPSCS